MDLATDSKNQITIICPITSNGSRLGVMIKQMSIDETFFYQHLSPSLKGLKLPFISIYNSMRPGQILYQKFYPNNRSNELFDID